MSGEVHAVAGHRVFDGAVVHEDAAVMIDGGQVAAIVPRTRSPQSNAGPRPS